LSGQACPDSLYIAGVDYWEGFAEAERIYK